MAGIALDCRESDRDSCLYRPTFSSKDTLRCVSNNDIHDSSVTKGCPKPMTFFDGLWTRILVLTCSYAIEALVVQVGTTSPALLAVCYRPPNVNRDVDQMADVLRRLHRTAAHFSS